MRSSAQRPSVERKKATLDQAYNDDDEPVRPNMDQQEQDGYYDEDPSSDSYMYMKQNPNSS